jgi:nucleoside-diphosphate-sugar epimerase
MRILVTGATGLIGCHAVSALLDAGHRLRVFVREPAKVDRVLAPFGRQSADVEIATGEITDASSVDAALEDCQALLHCAGLFSPNLADGDLLERVNFEGTRIVLESAIAHSLERIVFVSSMLVLLPPKGPRVTAEDDVTRPQSMYASTKARAERLVREHQERGAPIVIVYPAACQGPDDPTLSTGPQLVVNAVREGGTLVTEGGLAYTDVRDLAAVLSAVFAGKTTARRLMAPAFFLTHERYHALLSELTGRELRARRVPGWLMRGMGRLGDLSQRFGRQALLTSEAASVLTRSVPVDDREARRCLGREPITAEASFRDLLDWLGRTGHLEPESLGRLAEVPADELARGGLG